MSNGMKGVHWRVVHERVLNDETRTKNVAGCSGGGEAATGYRNLQTGSRLEWRLSLISFFSVQFCPTAMAKASLFSQDGKEVLSFEPGVTELGRGSFPHRDPRLSRKQCVFDFNVLTGVLVLTVVRSFLI